jgi:hypothetical protein
LRPEPRKNKYIEQILASRFEDFALVNPSAQCIFANILRPIHRVPGKGRRVHCRKADFC